ncbi:MULTISPECIES: hypothetical protein [Methylobacteriaceae]
MRAGVRLPKTLGDAPLVRMSQSIARKRFVHHNVRIVTRMFDLAPSGRTRTGLPARIVLSTLAGLLSLLVVIGLPADGAALGGIPQARGSIAFEQRPDTDPLVSVRTDRTMIDLDEIASHGRIAAAASGPDRVETGSPCRPVSDPNPAAADRTLPERPPRA